MLCPIFLHEKEKNKMTYANTIFVCQISLLFEKETDLLTWNVSF